MGSDNRKRKTGRRITRKRTNRTRMTNKKRTSKRLYKRSLRKNKYRSHKKRRTLKKGGRPTSEIPLSSRFANFGETLAQAGVEANQAREQKRIERETRRRTLRQTRHQLTDKKKKRRSNSGKGKDLKQYLLRKRNEGSLTKTALGVGAATAAGIGAVVAAPTLGVLGVGAATTAGVGAFGYGVKRGIESFGQDYSLDVLPVNDRKNELILKFNYKKDKNKCFYLISDKSSEYIDLLIEHMNYAYMETTGKTSRGGGPILGDAPDVDDVREANIYDDDDGDYQGTPPPSPVQSNSDDEEEEEKEDTDSNGFPLNYIRGRGSSLDVLILELEVKIEEEEDLGQEAEIKRLRKELHQKYDEKIDIIIRSFDSALNDPDINVDVLYDRFKEAIERQLSRSDMNGRNIILNQWILGTNEMFTNVKLTEINKNFHLTFVLPSEKNEKKEDIKLLKEKAKELGLTLKGKKLKDIYEEVVYNMNIDRKATKFIGVLDPKVYIDGNADIQVKHLQHLDRWSHDPTALRAAGEFGQPAAGASRTPPPVSISSVPETVPSGFSTESPVPETVPSGFSTESPPPVLIPPVAETVAPAQVLSVSPGVQKIFISEYTIANKRSGTMRAHPFFFEVTLHQGNEQIILPTFRLSELKKWVDQADRGPTEELENIGKKPSDKANAFKRFIDDINGRGYNIDWFKDFVNEMKTKHRALTLGENEGVKFVGNLPQPSAAVSTFPQELVPVPKNFALHVEPYEGEERMRFTKIEDVKDLGDLKSKVKGQLKLTPVDEWEILLNNSSIGAESSSGYTKLTDMSQLSKVKESTTRPGFWILRIKPLRVQAGGLYV